MINVGIIGCGSITKLRHAPEYKSNRDVDIKGFYDTRQDRAEEMSGMFGGRVYNSIDDMLADKNIDAVSVCTANVFHAPVSIRALEAGKHVLCEKPMATSVEDCTKMIEAAERNGKILMIGHNQRFITAHIKAKEILQSGEMGKILSFRTVFGHGGPEMWSADKSSGTWFFRKDAASMGAIGDLGIHKADLISWLIDDEITEVSAMTVTLDKKDDTEKLIEIDDNAICILKSQRGIVGTLSASWTYYGDEDNSTVVYCTGGAVKICSDRDYSLIVEKGCSEKIFYKLGNIYTNDCQTDSKVIDAFVKCIIRGERPPVSGNDGLKALKVVLACIKSSSKGSTIKIL